MLKAFPRVAATAVVLCALVVTAVSWSSPAVTRADEILQNGSVTLAEPLYVLQQEDEQEPMPGGGQPWQRAPWRRFWPNLGYDNENSRNHRSVREAFRSVVQQAVGGTVQVFCGNARVAFGTVIDSHGYILTKASELKDNPECRFSDGRSLPAQLVTIDDQLDVAVLRVEATNLTPVVWRRGEVPPRGSWLVTANTGELPLAIGIVSTEPREIPMPRAMLGVSLEDADNGARVAQVLPDSPAAEAGLQENDIVIEVNGKPTPSREALIALIRSMRPGDQVTVVVLREGERKEFTARLVEMQQLQDGRSSFQNNLGGPLSRRRWGFPMVVEHDATVRPSECGGPVVDLEGHAVGINIARAGRVVTYALPYKVLEPLIEDVKAGKYGPVGDLNEKELAARAEQLRQLLNELTDQIEELSRQIAEKQEVAAKGSTEAQRELNRLQEAVVKARSRLEETVKQLQKYEKAGAVSTGVSAMP